MSRSTQNTKLNPKRRWKRRHTRYEEEETAWGLTDDVVTLSNGEQYYYFKLPNKVRLNHQAQAFLLMPKHVATSVT